MNVTRNLTIAGIVLISGIAAYAASQRSLQISAHEVIASRGSQGLGFGTDHYFAEPTHHAMAYGRFASAAALLEEEPIARRAADWLAENSRPGWGLPFAYDSFSDGSMNPTSTVYAITTADAVRGLLDTFDLTGDETYRDAALAALDYYKQYFTATDDGGHFWYSDQPTDQIDTFNVSAMLAGQYARAGMKFQRPDYVTLATSALNHIWSRRQESDLGMFWSYSDLNSHPNSAVHAAFVVQGFLDYNRYVGTEFDVSSAVRYLRGFATDAPYSYRPHPDIAETLHSRTALLWDVGMLIYTLSDAGMIEDATHIASWLPRYNHEGGFGSRPGAKDNHARMNSYLALGLARLERARAGTSK